MSKDLKKMMGIEKLPTVKKDIPEADDDFNHARENLLNTIETCQKTIEKLTDISDQSGHPRFYEILNQTLKTMVEANKELLALQKQIRSIHNDSAEGPKNIINKQTNIFTSAEILEILQDAKMKTIENKED